MRQWLLGTKFGKLALTTRDAFELFSANYNNTESVGTLINDQLAVKLVTRLCLPGKAFLDVGAHIGSIIAEVARRDASIKLIAVEAIPDKVSNLRRKFPHLECYECAVSDTEGMASFFVNTKRSGYSSLVKGDINIEDAAALVEISVPVRKLDDIISSDSIDVIKIDVEGAELGVLRGAEKLMARIRPSIMFESGPTIKDSVGYPKEELWEWFDRRDFDVLVPIRMAHDGPALSQAGFVEAHYYPRRTTNYFAVPKERRREIRDRARQVLKK